MSENKQAPGKNSREKAGTKLPPIVTPPIPPVPNRAWTEMRLGRDIDDLSEMERRELYLGRDNLF